ncbi:MAG: MMPL family transporter [Pseudomonadota bacterium]
MNNTGMGAYERLVLGNPISVVIVCAIATLLGGWFSQDFALDATTDSLTLTDDADLRYYRSVRARYGSDEYLVVTFTPTGDLFSEPVLDDLRQLHDALAAVDGVDAVLSILNVPLIQSPPVPPEEITDGIRALEDPDTDRDLARKELLTSPIYRNLLVSDDGKTTALRVDFVQNETYWQLHRERNRLREIRLTRELTSTEADDLAIATKRFREYSDLVLDREEQQIAAIRDVLDQHRSLAKIYLGGVPMIVADSVAFIRNDLLVFGIGVLVFLTAVLAVAFRQLRWVLLPLVTCVATVAIMLGLLGATNWRVTVVSSNFVPLLLILCLALTLHIVVRYQETHSKNPDWDQLNLVSKAVRRIFVPSLYTAITTMVAFASLIVSKVQPVIDFGWMMVVGVAIAFVLSFTLLPAALMLLKPGKPGFHKDLSAKITAAFAHMATSRGMATLVVFFGVGAVLISGVAALSVENRFIDYYRKSTEIYQGMELIDRELGGTTPLEVIVDAPPPEPEPDMIGDDYDDDFEDIFADDTDIEAGITGTSHWFNSWRIGDVRRMHEYLDSLPETGKVLSLGTTAEVLTLLDPEIFNDNWRLSIVHRKLPDDVKQTLFEPYLSDDGQQLRFSMRVFESDPTLRRTELIDSIRDFMTDDMGFADEQVQLSGMLVLYNNMLQSLFRSQILTLGAVFLAIALTFFALFRSLRIASVAIIPNVLSAAIVLGVMGWVGVPLDIMTITIAAITIGIGVDDTIHYVHRFRHEFARDGDYDATVARSHATIGRAMYYTTITVMLGFSILALSPFIPTVYFGLLTGLAMLVALVANLALLPVLIVRFQAMGPGARLPAVA